MGIETDLNFIFIDRSTDMVWPAPGKAVVLNKGRNAFSVRCKLGERVCYSIYTKNGAQSWGLQPHSSCQQCCAICGDGGINIPTLSASTVASRNSNPSSPTDSDDNNTSVPAHKNPTLLETVYFLKHNREITEQNGMLSTAVDGTVRDEPSRLVEDHDDKIVEEWGHYYRETLTTLEDCGVQIDGDNLSNQTYNWSEVFRFNNIVPDYETGFDTVQERPKITLRAGVDESGQQKRAFCERNANGSTCDGSIVFWPQDSKQLIRFERAIKYIYSEFCSASGHPAKPF
jgi:hypothetical protein